MSIFASYCVVARLFDVSLPLKVSHEHCLAYIAGILPAVVVTGQLQVLIKLISWEGHIALGTLEICTWLAISSINHWVRNLFLANDLILACEGIFSADQTLPVGLVVSGNAQNETPLMIIVTTLEVNQLRAALIESVLADRAYFSPVEIRDLILELSLDFIQLSQFRSRQVSLDLVGLSPICLFRGNDREAAA